MSTVNTSGHEASIMTYRSDADKILQRIGHDQPDVVGFSLIFQYMAPDFGQVIEALREAGVTAHFTMGGHYASFEPTEILRRIRGLDSVVRFDGEMTLVNLLNCLSTGSEWRGLPGIAFRNDGGEIKVEQLAPVVEDLDLLPWPDRRSIDSKGIRCRRLPFWGVAVVRGIARFAVFDRFMKSKVVHYAGCERREQSSTR